MMMSSSRDICSRIVSFIAVLYSNLSIVHTIDMFRV